MYWYYKYPMILILLVSLAGLGLFTWKKLSPSGKDAPAAAVSVPRTAPAAPEPASPPAAASHSAVQPSAAPPAETGRAAAVQSDFEKLYSAATVQYENGFLEAARALARRAMGQQGIVEFDKNWFKAAELISLVNQRLMNSSAPASEKKRYTIQYGDSLKKIARQNYTSIEAILRLNPSVNKETLMIHPRQVLSLLPSAWRIRVSKSQFVLLLYNHNELYRLFHVGIGREDRTPAGTFVITSRLAHPAWTPPGKNIPYGDPENVLGSHWLGLQPFGDTDATLSGYGIHGTWEPESIGTGASAGCIRMRNEEVEELFDFIPEPGGQAAPVQVSIEE